MTDAQADPSGNPLLRPWTAPHGLPPFAEIEDAHLVPAVEAGLAQARAAIGAIAASPEAPSFGNTVEALERAETGLDRILSAVFTLASTDANSEREAAMRVLAPKLAAHWAETRSDPALYARIAALWHAREDLDLSPEQARLLLVVRRAFRRSGAELDPEGRARLAEITARLATLGTAFGQNLLADERDWTLPLADAVLARLPDFVANGARAAGRERGAAGPCLTLSRSSLVPFLETCPDRELRRVAFEAWVARGARDGATDNRAIAAEILALRSERAALLGFEDFAAFKLDPEMAGRPGAVRDLLMAVWEPARMQALREAEALTARLAADGVNGPLAPWDWRYYAEARRREEHALDAATLKAYFPLERMIGAAFACAERLFGLRFRERAAPLHHPDARAWEVTRDGRPMALFIGDYLARPSKRSGAWCSSLCAQSTLDGPVRPIVVNVCNFARPEAGGDTLLSYDDARTLFHEMGHALHHILSDVTYASLSGTSVARDFVELPSQLFEHWLDVPKVLDRHARHVETGEPLPAGLRDRLLAARKADQGFATVEYTASALVDLAFHQGEPPRDVAMREAEILAEIGMPPAIVPRHGAPHFAHIFGGDGYSAGYYSYMWSEVMDADAFDAFTEAGDPFDPDTAAALERHILSTGGSADPAELYRAFRGRMPGPEALLRGRGLAA